MEGGFRTGSTGSCGDPQAPARGGSGLEGPGCQGQDSSAELGAHNAFVSGDDCAQAGECCSGQNLMLVFLYSHCVELGSSTFQ